jgi:CRISPR/Cas system endoribonuclease Cas6 (RAMP superfamily)
MESIMEKVTAIKNMKGLEIEVCGSWIWVRGNTYEHRAALKAAEFHFCSNKKAWVWHPETASVGKHRPKSMQYIRTKYGSAVLNTEEQTA